MGATRIGAEVNDVEALHSLLCFLSPNEGVRPFEDLVERHPSLAEPGDEPAQGFQTTDEPLYDLFGVGLDTSFGHDVSKQLPLRNPKNKFFGVQLDVEPSEVHECCGQVCDQVASLSCFHHYVIYIDDDC